MSEFKSIHLKHPIPSSLDGSFDISAPPKTDIWDRYPEPHSFNAPIIYRTTTRASFQYAKLTVTAKWEERYDQGGLCIIIQTAPSAKYIKAGIELEVGSPHTGIVVKDNFSDWSLHPVPFDQKDVMTIEAVVDGGDLWVYALGPDGKREPLRQVTWWSSVPAETEVWVGPYAAKPAPSGGDKDLIVHFSGMSIETKWG